MAIFKDKKEVRLLKEAGRRLAFVLEKTAASVRPGGTPKELDAIAERQIRGGGDVPAFLGYRPVGAARPYTATLCVSVNDEVVHGIPTERAFEAGDIVSIDAGLVHEGVVVDMAVTVPVGEVDEAAEALIRTTRRALKEGIKAAKAGGRVGDIGHATERAVGSSPFSIVRSLGGHGTGRELHEAPFIPNFGKKRTGAELVPGMALALEPIVAEGAPGIVLCADGYTYRTADGKRSAHFEHTILITASGPVIVTNNA